MNRPLAAVGVLALAGAAVATFLPGPAPPLLLVSGIALAIALVALLVLSGAVGAREPAAFDAGTAGHRAPGDDVDALLAGLSARGRRDASAERRRLRERLETTAVAVLTRREDCSPERARDSLAAGDWTDDPLAAAYFRDDDVARAAHLRAVATGEPPTRRRARRAIDELHRLDGREGRSESEGAAG